MYEKHQQSEVVNFAGEGGVRTIIPLLFKLIFNKVVHLMDDIQGKNK